MDDIFLSVSIWSLLVILVIVLASDEYIPIKSKVFYSQESPGGESTSTVSGVNYQLHAVLHVPDVVIDHNQQWTMASEMVDPIDKP